VKRVAKLILGTSCVGLLLLLPGRAAAAGGHYSIDGGTVAERGQVRAALEASTFDWNVVPETVAIHIRRSSWCSGGEAIAHDDNTCERFATAVAWAYWPSAQNAFNPAQASGASWLHPATLPRTARTPGRRRRPVRAGARQRDSPETAVSSRNWARSGLAAAFRP
jgi:hypothetical protein